MTGNRKRPRSMLRPVVSAAGWGVATAAIAADLILPFTDRPVKAAVLHAVTQVAGGLLLGGLIGWLTLYKPWRRK